MIIDHSASFNHQRKVTYAIELLGSGFVKIGVTVDPRRRLRQLQVMSPYELRLLGALPGDHERAMHMRFRKRQVRGEWFRASPEIRRAFARKR